jgi:hypothetical protein
LAPAPQGRGARTDRELPRAPGSGRVRREPGWIDVGASGGQAAQHEYKRGTDWRHGTAVRAGAAIYRQALGRSQLVGAPGRAAIRELHGSTASCRGSSKAPGRIPRSCLQRRTQPASTWGSAMP